MNQNHEGSKEKKDKKGKIIIAVKGYEPDDEELRINWGVYPAPPVDEKVCSFSHGGCG